MDDQNNSQHFINFQTNFFSKFKFLLAKNKYIIIFIIILSILSFAVTEYLLITYKKPSILNQLSQNDIFPDYSVTDSPQKIISKPPTTPTPTPNISLPDPTASWSAYVSSKYSYSIKYPLSWTAQITTQEDPKILEYVVFNPVATKAGTLSITLSYGTRSYLEALALDPQVGETITIASVSAIKKDSKDSGGNKAINIIVPVGLYSIVFNAKNAYADLFDQMLTTLNLPK